ncbi:MULTISPECIES: hypothetical protein [unclassified Pseudomonas]|uniref:hypothetical protein n=1 Tax=unclassified Pseudomonas TaxID=196821 RepID=UPI00244CB0D6|nr:MULTISPECIES: hypothetical protein [unclassified Pseudomonas]MDH0892897.1 hypothetical protein [Pseudomonas sp. GD03875]MDH1064629.1 hypothetical protein [Pseudomonas sp. GD03985]
MRRILAIAIWATILPFSTESFAEWKRAKLNDEVRNVSSDHYSVQASPINGVGPALAINIFDDKSGSPKATLKTFNASILDCKAEVDVSTCNISYKLDEGKVIDEVFYLVSADMLVPSKTVELAGAIAKSKSLYIEIPTKAGGKLQYKFSTSGLTIEVNRYPKVSISGYTLGERYTDLGTDLALTSQKGNSTCYDIKNPSGVLGAAKVSSATLCFVDQVFYMALVQPGTKKSYDSISSFLDKVFGSRDKDLIYPRWPKDDARVSLVTRNASYFTFVKNSYTDFFMISDEIESKFLSE